MEACNAKTTHLFVNALDDENALANAISKCGPLKVKLFSLYLDILGLGLKS